VKGAAAKFESASPVQPLAKQRSTTLREPRKKQDAKDSSPEAATPETKRRGSIPLPLITKEEPAPLAKTPSGLTQEIKNPTPVTVPFFVSLIFHSL